MEIDDVEAGRAAVGTLRRVGRRVIQIVVEMDAERVARLDLDERAGQATAVGAKKDIVHDAGAGVVDLVVAFDDIEIERDKIAFVADVSSRIATLSGYSKEHGLRARRRLFLQRGWSDEGLRRRLGEDRLTQQSRKNRQKFDAISVHGIALLWTMMVE